MKGQLGDLTASDGGRIALLWPFVVFVEGCELQRLIEGTKPVLGVLLLPSYFGC